jgi:hypothetical protein
MIKLKWHEEIPDNVLELEHIVLQDLVKLHDDMEKKPSSLIFHTVYATDDLDGPIVHVWGEDDDDEHYHCKYDPKPIWESWTEKELKDSVDNDQEKC